MNGTREKIFCNLLKKPKKTTAGSIWNKIFHFYCLYVLGFEFSPQTQVGENLSIVHGARGSVVNPRTIIGNNVNIGSNSCIIGHITIGDNVIIGAGSIVVKDVPANAVVVGNPAKVIRYIDATSEKSI